jgi:hypothetical protein
MFRPLLGHHQVNLQNISYFTYTIQHDGSVVWTVLPFQYFVSSLDDGPIRAETCREYVSYLIKTLSIVAKQKVLLFTANNLICFIRHFVYSYFLQFLFYSGILLSSWYLFPLRHRECYLLVTNMRLTTNICRNLRTQQMSVIVLLCTSYTTCFGLYWWPSSGGL